MNYLSFYKIFIDKSYVNILRKILRWQIETVLSSISTKVIGRVKNSMLKQPKCKITVIKRSLNKDIINDHMKEDMKDLSLCSIFKEGDEFLVYSEFHVPDNFCHWAWADIRKDIIAIINDVQYPWFKEKGITISGCTDWFKPVLFKIEKITE